MLSFAFTSKKEMPIDSAIFFPYSSLTCLSGQSRLLAISIMRFNLFDPIFYGTESWNLPNSKKKKATYQLNYEDNKMTESDRKVGDGRRSD